MSRKLSTMQAINEALEIAMTSDPDVILMGEDVVGGGGRHAKIGANLRNLLPSLLPKASRVLAFHSHEKAGGTFLYIQTEFPRYRRRIA